MEISDDNGCFVCGQDNPAGLRAQLVSDIPGRRASCRIAIGKSYQGWSNIVHGGILATLLDETCAYAGKTVARHVVTAEMTVRYKKPVPVEREMVIQAEVRTQRKRILEMTATIEIDGVVHAEADARMFIVE